MSDTDGKTTTPTAKSSPTRLGGRAPSSAPGGMTPPARVSQNPRDSMPPDVAAAFGQPVSPADPGTGTTSIPPAGDLAASLASPLATQLAGQQASKGGANPAAARATRKRTNGAAVPSVSLASLLGSPLDPDDDLVNPGWRFPRYYREAVRLLAFRLRKDQQDVAAAIMRAGWTGEELAGVLEGIDLQDLTRLFEIARESATGSAVDDD